MAQMWRVFSNTAATATCSRNRKMKGLAIPPLKYN